VSVSAIAKGLELSPRTIRDWMDRGVIPADCADALAAAKCLIRHYQGVAGGYRSSGANGAEVLDLTEERAKLTKAQSETAELRNAELRGELIRRDELRSAWADRVLSWKERLRAIPAAATVHVPGFSAAMGRALATLIDETLTELADGISGGGDGNGVGVKRARRRAGVAPPAA
jgi:phage terminase Nu1 subunit (DNA packaging protein)